jgi:hypothetical protein
MTHEISTSSRKAVVRTGYLILLIGSAVGLSVAAFSPRAALLPAAVIFGWVQIGGL